MRLLFTEYNDVGKLILRLFFGLTMVFAHGLGKLSGFGDRMDSFPDPLGVGSTMSLALVVGAEFFCALAVALGLFTRAALIPLIITMFVAVFVIHGEDPFKKQELGLTYLFAYLALFFAGAGRFSVDALLARRVGGHSPHNASH